MVRAREAVALDAADFHEWLTVAGARKDTFATDAARRGVPERLIQAFLAHADVRSIRRYARLANEALIEVLPKNRTP